MNQSLELELLAEIKDLKQEIKIIKGEEHFKVSPKPSYQYSKIKESDLEQLFEIERHIDKTIFEQWFNQIIDFDDDVESMLIDLITENQDLIECYSEEDLKVNFIIPLLNEIHFKSVSDNVRGFYEQALTYETDTFIFNGTTDFMVSLGLLKSKTPYFFIQEFKRSEEYGNPRPQLVAELISAVELNGWKTIKGAYVIGAMWHFVILEKLADNQYQYFVSHNFDSMRLDDLKAIYHNLLTVKSEIINTIQLNKHK